MLENKDKPIIETTMKVKCCHCNEEIDFKIYPLIDLQKNTELYSELFSLDLFRCICPKCKQLNIFQYDTLIIDRFKNYMIYLQQPNQIQNFRKDVNGYFDKLKSSNNIKLLQVLNNLKHTRLVYSLNDMLEKLLIYDYDLNDKIIELIKRGLYQNKLLDQNEFNCIAFNKIDQDKLSFTCFSTNTDGKPSKIKQISVNIKYYNSLVDSLGNAINEIKENDFPIIDKNWAKNIVELTRGNKNE